MSIFKSTTGKLTREARKAVKAERVAAIKTDLIKTATELHHLSLEMVVELMARDPKHVREADLVRQTARLERSPLEEAIAKAREARAVVDEAKENIHRLEAIEAARAVIATIGTPRTREERVRRDRLMAIILRNQE